MPSFSKVARWFLFLTMLVVSFGVHAAVDAALDAKRKAGAQFLRDGKLPEAIAILTEAAGSPQADYRDHLALARALERANRLRDAGEAYRKVISLVSDSVRESDAKSARAEAERRLKILDPVSDKLRQICDRFIKDLDSLERDAELAHSEAAVEQILRLRAVLPQNDPNPNVLYFNLTLKPTIWVTTGFKVVAGQRYRCRARGTWHTGNVPDVECNANGLPDKRNQFGPIGTVLASVDEKTPFFSFGVDGDFKAPFTGTLYLSGNQEPNLRVNSSGSLIIVIEKKD